MNAVKRSTPSKPERLCAVALVLAFGLAACNRAPSTKSPTIAAGDAVVGKTWATFGRWGDGIAVLVWSDTLAARTKSAMTGGRAEYSGTHAGEGGKGTLLKWSCRTPDGKTGTVTINGTDYDLVGGPVFLVKVRDAKTFVKQMKRDTANLKSEELPKVLEKWRSSAPEIDAFFSDPK